VTDETVDATFHVQLDPVWSQYDDEKVIGAKAARMTLGKPDQPRGGAVMVKLTVRLPKQAFLPLRPEAVIIIPAERIIATPIEVTAEDPSS
jgi:hypothetical protein